ncbi:MAG: NAD(P)-binding domain-containing protein [Ignavibacteria bacterium]
MEVIIENVIAYGLIFLVLGATLFIYYKMHTKKSSHNLSKLEKAIELGFHEPLSLHPVVDANTCIGSGACIKACPEKDILGIVNGQAHLINASRCVGHGACFNACPVHAITLCIGTEKRGVELPHLSAEFETNVPGLFIAGELGGMGLIKNAVEQGNQAMENICKSLKEQSNVDYDAIIIGAGPAGISAALSAARNKIKFLVIEQDSLGGSVFNFPRAKIIMTHSMNLPLYGKVKLSETSKSELLNLWTTVLNKYEIKINEQEKAENIEKNEDHFLVRTTKGTYSSKKILLAVGRRGSPRKLGIPGEGKEKVAYRLIEPELIHNEKILIVGGGDSAVEAALMLADEANIVTLSYRGDTFSRLKPKNLDRINESIVNGRINVIFNSNPVEIKDNSVVLSIEEKKEIEIENNLVFIFAGGELPTKFLEKIGVKIYIRRGEAIFKHEN